MKAVDNAVSLEEIARMARFTEQTGAVPLETYVSEKHYLRKHGPNAYYGQK